MTSQIDALKYEVKHIRAPISPGSKDWQATADQWLFIFDNGITCPYYTGIGYRVVATHDKAEFNRLKHATLTPHGLEQFLRLSKPVKPDIKGLIYSLWTDKSAENMSFKDWCADFGYDTDSRKALETYEACQQSGETLKKLGITEDLTNYLEGY